MTISNYRVSMQGSKNDSSTASSFASVNFWLWLWWLQSNWQLGRELCLNIEINQSKSMFLFLRLSNNWCIEQKRQLFNWNYSPHLKAPVGDVDERKPARSYRKIKVRLPKSIDSTRNGRIEERTIRFFLQSSKQENVQTDIPIDPDFDRSNLSSNYVGEFWARTKRDCHQVFTFFGSFGLPGNWCEKQTCFFNWTFFRRIRPCSYE